MVGKDQEEFVDEEYKNITFEYGLEEGQELKFKDPPKWHRQGSYLNIRRICRFASYSIWNQLPSTKYKKQFNPAYLPLTRRYHKLSLAGAVFVLYQFMKFVGDS
ncbi:hypothetical protein SteCoe_3645 [Stentor coeruleus]|uniref:Uncharacterized protein n=1 Tax=Stentor coeruleus TaxID=5963 RepID=A0A1R2CWM5_9CILI|nr:hypothetical protein SteCoe_3645 [Stentor coeruleus]